MASELEPCPFCSKTMMLRSALWPSEGDADAIIHADPTDCPMLGFSDGSADGSIIEKWNCSLSNEDDFPSDGSCVRCGSVPRNANGLCNTCLDEDAERLENTRTTPVAPVSPDTDGKCGELVTVAWQRKHPTEGWMDCREEDIPHYRDHGQEVRELSPRSQAAELLAAERAKTERWHKKAMDAGVIVHSDGTTSHPMRKERDDLKADNARKDYLLSVSDTVAQQLQNQIVTLTLQKEALEAKLAAAEKALEEADEALQADAIASAHAAIRAVLGGKSS